MTNSHRILHQVLVAVLIALGAAGLSAKESVSTVTCTDGTTSKGGKGACSHHGGIAKGATEPGQNSPKPAEIGIVDSVKCKDGTSSPHGGKGACSGHGGIDKSAANDKSNASPSATPHSEPMNTPSAALPGKATAKCKDGSLSNSKHHSGTCSGHGGVDQWLDGSK